MLTASKLDKYVNNLQTELLIWTQRPGYDRSPTQPQHFAKQIRNLQKNQPSCHTRFVNNKYYIIDHSFVSF